MTADRCPDCKQHLTSTNPQLRLYLCSCSRWERQKDGDFLKLGPIAESAR